MRPLLLTFCAVTSIISATLLTACQGTSAATNNSPAAAAPANVSEVTTVADFDQRISRAKTPVVVDCYATWCEPCSMLSPELDAVAAAHVTSLTVLRVDVDRVPELAQRYHAEAIPLLVLIKQGAVASQQVGYQNRAQITSWLGL